MRAQISGQRNKLVAIPDPVVIKNECAVKGFKLLSDGRLMLIGQENGDIKVGDRKNFAIYTQQRFISAPILKIDQVMEAVLIQHKDPKGTILICKPPSQSNRYELKVVSRIETMNASFTTFAATALVSPSITTHLAIVTQDDYSSHSPKIWLMNQTCDQVISTAVVEAIPSASLHEVQQHANHILKQQVNDEVKKVIGGTKAQRAIYTP